MFKLKTEGQTTSAKNPTTKLQNSTHFSLRDLFKLAPRNIYLATSSPLPSTVTENVTDTSLELVVSSELRRRREGFGQSKSNAKGHSCMETELFGLRMFLSAQGAISPPDCNHACHTTLNGQFQQPFAFEMFICPALSVLPKFTKN